MRQQKLFLFICLLAVFQPFWAHAQSLRIVTEHWPPMTYEKSGTPEGMAVELVRLIQKNLENKAEIEVMPWSRAYHIATTKPNVLLFTVLRTLEREKLFTMMGPIAEGEIALYIRSKPNSKILPSVDTIKSDLTVGAHRGTAFHHILEQQGFKKIIPVNSSESAVKMLMTGRLDILCDDELVVPELFRRSGYDIDDFQKVASLTNSGLYLAFSRGTDASLINHWKNALSVMLHDGSLEALHRKWFSHIKAPKKILLLTPPQQVHLLEKPETTLQADLAPTMTVLFKWTEDEDKSSTP